MKIGEILTENDENPYSIFSSLNTRYRRLVIDDLKHLYPFLRRYAKPQYTLELDEEIYNRIVRLPKTAKAKDKEIEDDIRRYEGNLAYTITAEFIEEVMNDAKYNFDIETDRLARNSIKFKNPNGFLVPLIQDELIVGFDDRSLTNFIPLMFIPDGDHNPAKRRDAVMRKL